MRAIAHCTLALFIGVSGISGLWGMQDSPTYAEEYDLYKKAEAETDPAKRKAILLEFAKTYSSSVLDPNVSYLYAQYFKPLRDRKQWKQLANTAVAYLAHRPTDTAAAQAATEAYQQLGEPRKLVETGSQLYQAAPNANTAYFVAKAYQSLGDTANFQTWGQRTLRHDPNNLQILVELSNSYWQGNDFAKAGDYAKKGLAAVDKAKKPDGQTAAQWDAQLNQVRAFCYRAIGEQAYVGKNMDTARKNLEESIKYDAKNDFAHYRLGMVYWSTGKTQQAILELAKGFVLNGPSSKESRDQLNQLYKATYGNTNGLTNIIQKAREEVGSGS